MGNSITVLNNTLNKTEAQINNLSNKLKLQEAQIERLVISSPVNGTISDLKFTSPGRVVSRGNPVAVIIPVDARPMVIAVVANKDVAFVHEGVPARIKVHAYPFRQFGTIPAKVLKIFPMPNKPTFQVRLALERSTIRVRGQDRELTPGLTVQADLLTERKRLLEIILNKMN